MAVGAEGDLATSHRIAAGLKEAILTGKYPPGTRIRQEDIAEQYGASRSPVREAFRMLDADGLLTLIANTGAWISQLSLAECEEMYQIRERVEPLLLRSSMPKLDAETMAKLHALVKQLEESEDVENFLLHDREFHLLTYVGASTALLGDMVQRLWNTTQHYRRAYTRLLAVDGFKSAHYEHHLLLSAIERGDNEDAERILYGHIRRTRLELAKHPEVFA
ncbi:MAG TPA: GntR family transcriptional regulator [Candidatus Nanopelagicaceae bacterium]|nr:GntR family transcriptional regulator [Candidatus Nanopelagicaceae bacterium]